MTSHANLLRDDYETVAERISAHVRSEGRKTLVRVLDTGRLRYDLPGRLGDVPTQTVVGTYDRDSRIEQIEGDLLVRLRELMAAA